MENIVQLEKKYWKGMETGDLASVKSLTRFPCIVAGKNGVRSVDEATFEKMFKSGEGQKVKMVSFADEQVELVEGIAMIGYVIELEYAAEEKKLIKKCSCSSAWIRENDGKWRCGLHSETEMEDKE